MLLGTFLFNNLIKATTDQFVAGNKRREERTKIMAEVHSKNFSSVSNKVATSKIFEIYKFCYDKSLLAVMTPGLLHLLDRIANCQLECVCSVLLMFDSMQRRQLSTVNKRHETTHKRNFERHSQSITSRYKITGPWVFDKPFEAPLLSRSQSDPATRTSAWADRSRPSPSPRRRCGIARRRRWRNADCRRQSRSICLPGKDAPDAQDRSVKYTGICTNINQLFIHPEINDKRGMRPKIIGTKAAQLRRASW